MNNEQIAKLFKASVKKPQGRKVWSVDLETVWIPFFVASNTAGISRIASDAIGAPLRLDYNEDGSVKFSKSGKPVIRVAKDIAENVRLVRENFVSGLMDFTHSIVTSKPDDFKAQIQQAQKAGKPITERDNANLTDAMSKIVNEAIEHAEHAEHVEAEHAEADKELVTA